MKQKQRIPVSEAQARLSQLLKHLQEEPEIVFEITVNGQVFGELRAPEARQAFIQPGEALLQALKIMKKLEPETPPPPDRSVARQHNEYLYSHKRR